MTRPKGGQLNWDDPSGIESADPYARLLAAVIKLAIRDAKRSDFDAACWLREEMPKLLAYLVPDGIESNVIYTKMLTIAGIAAEDLPAASGDSTVAIDPPPVWKVA